MIFKDIIEKNCKLLKIPVPAVVVVAASELPTPTTRAALRVNACDVDASELVINRDYEAMICSDELQAWLTLSHEIRHLWQVRHKANDLDGYRQSGELDVRTYNEQDLEIDAWAWSAIAVAQVLGGIPDFENLFGKDVAKKIFERAKKILENTKNG